MKLIRPGMGTESSSKILAALISMARPKLVVEIGAGDSTVFIASALQQARSDWQIDRDLVSASEWTERTALLDPVDLPDAYQPRLITIDNFTAEGSSAEEAWTTLREAGIDRQVVTFVQEDFFRIDAAVMKEWGPIDLAWIDAGTPADDVRFVATLWDRIVPGGYLCLHEPVMTMTVDIEGSNRIRKVRSPIWEELIHRMDNSFELITIPEPHKYRQCGIGIIRKKPAEERPIRSETLQEELISIGEIPIRSDYLPIASEALQFRARRRSRLSALSSNDNRLVYAAIVLGKRSVTDISDSTKLDSRSVSKCISRLQSVGLVERAETGLRDTNSAWNDDVESERCHAARLSDKDLEDDLHIEMISTAFHAGMSYNEFEASAICRLFTDDFARLRRYLVDRGILRRSGAVYSLIAKTKSSTPA